MFGISLGFELLMVFIGGGSGRTVVSSVVFGLS